MGRLWASPAPAVSKDSLAPFAALEGSADNRRVFSPATDDVRSFFVTVRRKRAEGTPLTPLEALAGDWIGAHPEYAADLADEQSAQRATYGTDASRENPFLHLSMHLSISEQASIDQPRGIRQAIDALSARLGSAHDAHHEVMECLGRMLWESQQSSLPPDGEAYIDCVRRRASSR